MKTVFIVVNQDSFLLSHRSRIVSAAVQTGYRVAVVAGDTGLGDRIEAMGAEFIPMRIDPASRNPMKELGTLLFLRSLYRRRRPDAVHHVGLKTMLWGTLAAASLGRIAVVNAVSGLGRTFSGRRRSLAARLVVGLLRVAHRRTGALVIFQNDYDRDLFLRARITSPAQVRMTTGSGVDLDIFAPCKTPPPGRVRIVLAARMIRSKGIHDFARAAALIKEGYDRKVQFVLCGGTCKNPDAIPRRELMKMCDGDYFLWQGHCQDMAAMLRGCHVAVLPSFYREGVPRSLIEAAAAGLPIITTDIPGCRDTVEEGVNGFIVPPHDPHALADRLCRLVNDAQLRLKMGRNSRRLAERRFDVREVVALHLQIYDQLCNRESE